MGQPLEQVCTCILVRPSSGHWTTNYTSSKNCLASDKSHMNHADKREATCRRWHEVLFSANLGLAITMISRTYIATVVPRRSKLLDFTIRMVLYINSTLGLRPQQYNPTGLEITFAIVLIAAGLGVLLALWALPKRPRSYASLLS